MSQSRTHLFICLCNILIFFVQCSIDQISYYCIIPEQTNISCRKLPVSKDNNIAMEGAVTETLTPVKPNAWSTSSSPWGKPQTPVVPCSLEDVMSEQLASELQEKEESLQTQSAEGQVTLAVANQQLNSKKYHTDYLGHFFKPWMLQFEKSSFVV